MEHSGRVPKQLYFLVTHSLYPPGLSHLIPQLPHHRRRMKSGNSGKEGLWNNMLRGDEVWALAVFSMVLTNPGDWKCERKDVSAESQNVIVGFAFSVGMNYTRAHTDFPQHPLLHQAFCWGNLQESASRLLVWVASACTLFLPADPLISLNIIGAKEGGWGPVGVALEPQVRTHISRQWLWPCSGFHYTDVQDANICREGSHPAPLVRSFAVLFIGWAVIY